MTSGIKTVQNPRWICIACKDARQVCGTVSDILNECGYNTCMEDGNPNTDFVVSVYNGKDCPADLIKNVVVFDENTAITRAEIDEFRHKVTSYENSSVFGDDTEVVLTYSAENYSADITCRNVVQTDDFVSFDLIGGEILFRIRANAKQYTLGEILTVIAVLMATGIPLAAVVAYFNRA